MTTAAAQLPARVPTPPDSKPKPPTTSNLQPESSAASKTRAGQAPVPVERSASPQKAGGARRAPRTSTPDPLSDKATAFLIRRILCPQHPDKGRASPVPIEDLLPPLTSRNDVDLQLYALIAIILREYVQNWYTKITPDETFVAEIVQIIAHITRALEQRLRKVDLESLLFDELPDLVDKHITAYRAAHDPITRPPVRTDPREIYHSLCPLPALSPVPRPDDPESITAQAENEAAYRQLLVQAVLAVLLPTEDLENGCLIALVGQLFSELIIGNAVANRLSEPWLIWELLIIASRTVRGRGEAEHENTARPGKGSPDSRGGFSAQSLFWTILQWCFLATSFIRTAFVVLLTSGSTPPRAAHGVAPHKVGREKEAMPLTSSSEMDSQPSIAPVLAFRCWFAISNLAEMDTRMPWLCGALSMLQWLTMTGPGRIAAVNGRLDRLLSYGIHKHLLDAANLPPLLRGVRGALFPNNSASNRKPTLVPPSSDAELRSLKRQCASSLWALLPRVVGRVLFGGNGLLMLLPLRAANATSTATGAANLDSSTSVPDTARGEEGSALLAQPKKRRRPGDSDDDRGASSTVRANKGVGPDRRILEENAAKLLLVSETAAGGAGPSRSSGRSAPAPIIRGLGGAADRAAGSSASVSGEASGRATSIGKEDRDAAGQQTGGGDEKDDDEEERRREQDEQVEEEVEEEDDETRVVLDEIERSVLDVFGDAYCNKHLVYAALELVLVRLVPELAEKGVVELLGERIPISPPAALGL